MTSLDDVCVMRNPMMGVEEYFEGKISKPFELTLELLVWLTYNF
jgi:hypothetical protein